MYTNENFVLREPRVLVDCFPFNQAEFTLLPKLKITCGLKSRSVPACAISSTGELANAEDWKKVVGNAILVDGEIERKAEIHWYQCNGVGKCMMKVKRWKK